MENDIATRRLQLFSSMLSLFPAGRYLDLGTGHGAFAIRAADLGWDACGIDARPDRIPADPRVTWVVQDLREFNFEPFDLIGCLGVFYHLTVVDQLELLRRCKGRPIILDTHVANGRGSHHLGREIAIQGYLGRRYREPGRTTSSWRNTHSFWATPDSLYEMLNDCGYPTVLEANPWVVPDRTFFLALPHGFVAGADSSK